METCALLVTSIFTFLPYSVNLNSLKRKHFFDYDELYIPFSDFIMIIILQSVVQRVANVKTARLVNGDPFTNRISSY